MKLEITLSPETFSASCYGGSNGRIVMNPSGGNGNYDFAVCESYLIVLIVI